MSKQGDQRKFLTALRRQGCTVTKTRSGHFKCQTPSGKNVILARESDPHSRKNMLAELRRHGVDLRSKIERKEKPWVPELVVNHSQDREEIPVERLSEKDKEAENLRIQWVEAFKRSGLSLPEAAEYMECSVPVLRAYVKGESPPRRANQIVKVKQFIADELGGMVFNLTPPVAVPVLPPTPQIDDHGFLVQAHVDMTKMSRRQLVNLIRAASEELTKRSLE